MLLENQIAEVIETQQAIFRTKEVGLEREMLLHIPNFENHVLIVSGIRRCGKSTLLRQLFSRTYKNAIYLNFEDVRLSGFDIDDFSRLSKIIDEKKIKTLLFDEIQVVKNWELFVRQKLEEQYRIIITGSNASLLSRELGTKLTGRHISIELFPFSFNEFNAFLNTDNYKKTIDEYLTKGGFPEVIKRKENQLLNQLLTDILQRDVAVRYNIRDITRLRQLAVYLISNIGKPFSGKKLTESFELKSNSTTLEYISHMEQAYLIQLVPKFSYSLKTQARNPKKVYTIDIGLFSQNSIVFSDENGRRLENLVYLHIRRKYEQIYYFKEKGECDFVAIKNGKAEELVQVCWEVNDINQKREINGLLEAMEYFQKDHGTIITYNQSEKITIKNKTIKFIPVHKYLSE
ncbi:Archaeal ATPase [Salinivirga cyanobacteriivorans]|uniref:Archaeal ATPase n=1 Tax=Salinivirga cyanobacteriivorans TaxID=1307839 RepID=A0A0S2HXY0_9BACT|nr:ATP-binding protein [Salinivirga cyanobacteriivorans]ALO14875.1 Archaeal ATPase [Salinivirga cyanobacteriivorans]